MKIAIAGIATESCSFSPLSTRLEDFHLTRSYDAAFAELYSFLPQFTQVHIVGLLTAKAMPGGPAEPRAYTEIKDEILTGLERQLPLDGIYLDMHGAMIVAGIDDAEGDFCAAIRALVGSDCLISASYDLHGNISQRLMSNLDIITAYRTAPHIDVIETRERALSLLVRCLREKIRPQKALVKIPVGLPGEKTSTEWEPGRSIYQAIPREIDGRRVMDASIQVGYVWADEPRMSACAIAIGTDPCAIAESAQRLAQRFWRHRAAFRFGVEAYTVDDCIRRAMTEIEYPALISDSGDNPTAGGVGDVTCFLRRALALGPADLVYASIPDREAVQVCIRAGFDAEVELEIGGLLDTRNSRPLPIRGRVEFLLLNKSNPHVLLRKDGIRIILTAQRTAFHRRQQFLNLGITPEAHQIVAVKVGYLVPELKAMARVAYLALSPGAVNQDIVSLPFKRIRRPCYPFDPDMNWTPQVQLF